MEDARKRGVVKWFDNKKGFGFIVDEKETETQYFVHYTEVNKKSKAYRTLHDGQQVSFEAANDGKGPKAVDVRFL